MNYEVRLLDRFEIVQCGEPVRVRGALCRAVAYVAVCGGHAQRSMVASTLWPDHPEERALANLRSLLWRGSVEHAGLMFADGAEVRFGDDVRVDYLIAFAQPACNEPMSLGTLLPDVEEEWLRLPRTMFRQYQVQRAEQAARELIADGRHRDAQQILLAVIKRHEARESAHRLLSESLEATGDLDAAAHVHELLRQHLLLRKLTPVWRPGSAHGAAPENNRDVRLSVRLKDSAA